MVATRNVMKCLPLLAAVLGKRYGVRITQGGDTAYTDGGRNVVNLPSLPVGPDDETLSLVRGYIDHEAGGHLRYTDFNALNRAKLDPRTMNIWNAIEDWRVEGKLSEVYPGCKANLAWLVRKVFTGEWKPSGRKESLPFEHVLLTCRSWTIPEVDGNLRLVDGMLENAYPGLKDEIDEILVETKKRCPDTKTAIERAREIEAAIRKRIPPTPPKQNQQPNPRKRNGQAPQGGENGQEDFLPPDLGALVRGKLGGVASKTSPMQRSGVAEPQEKKLLPLYDDEYQAALQASAGLRAKLGGTLQAQTLRRVAPGRHGKLDGKSLHRMFTGNPKVFRRDSDAIAVDTAVHLLIDVSGSMAGSGIKTARQAAYALAVALGGVKGVSLGVTCFPATTFDKATVLPVLKHGQRVHRNFSFEATGSTPMAEAMLWAFQTLLQRGEPRKVILIITDGCPDNPMTCRHAAAEAARLGIEIYGIGIEDPTVENLFPNKSIVVQSLSELTPKLFRMLQDVLVKKI